MNNMKIINTLMKSEIFTPSEKVVSHYILKNKEKVLSMSIQDLSQKSFTSNPTILRVCRKCGCKGYKDFKILLAKEAEQLTYEISQINGDIPFQKMIKMLI